MFREHSQHAVQRATGVSRWDLSTTKRAECLNRHYVGLPQELQIAREATPATAAERINRATINRDSVRRARTAALRSIVCVETHTKEQTHPWVTGKAVGQVHDAECPLHTFNAETDLVRFEPVRANEPILKVQLLEALDAGSKTFFASELTVDVPAKSVRVVDIAMDEARASARVQVPFLG